jgi:hypothetical protein
MKRLLILTAVIYGIWLTLPAQAQSGPSSNSDPPRQSSVRKVADLLMAAGLSDVVRAVERPKSLSIVPVQEPGGPHISSPDSIQVGGGTCVEGQARRQPC